MINKAISGKVPAVAPVHIDHNRVVNENPKLDQIDTEVNVVSKVLVGNVAALLENQESILNLELKTIKMKDESEEFRKHARDVKYSFCWQHYRHILITFVILVV